MVTHILTHIIHNIYFKPKSTEFNVTLLMALQDCIGTLSSMDFE